MRNRVKQKILPLKGVVSPRTENTIETGVGYSTDVGPRVKASWKKPWMNSYGHSLTTSTSISAPEQVLDFSYKMPLLKNPLEQYYLVQGGFKRTDLNDTEQGLDHACRFALLGPFQRLAAGD
ncbi:outer membrane protein, OMP85 family [Salmonella enterica subsp. enterica]|nr:outer membrane protein, OMP85 family [Salmonella enterica subsp. enterica]